LIISAAPLAVYVLPTAYKSSDKSFDFVAECKLDVVTIVSKLLRVVSFDCAFLVTFHVDHTAVNIYDDGFAIAHSQEPSKEFEIDFPQHLGCFVTEVFQESGYRFRFFDRNGKLVNQGIALQQFQSFQFINRDKNSAEQSFYVVHLNLIGQCIVKNQIVINQIKNPILIGMFKQ